MTTSDHCPYNTCAWGTRRDGDRGLVLDCQNRGANFCPVSGSVWRRNDNKVTKYPPEHNKMGAWCVGIWDRWVDEHPWAKWEECNPSMNHETGHQRRDTGNQRRDTGNQRRTTANTEPLTNAHPSAANGRGNYGAGSNSCTGYGRGMNSGTGYGAGSNGAGGNGASNYNARLPFYRESTERAWAKFVRR